MRKLCTLPLYALKFTEKTGGNAAKIFHPQKCPAIHCFSLSHALSLSLSLCRLRNMQGQRQSELTADVELLPTTDTSKTKQTARVPISMNFEVT